MAHFCDSVGRSANGPSLSLGKGATCAPKVTCFTVYFFADLHRLRAPAPLVVESAIVLSESGRPGWDLNFTWKNTSLLARRSLPAREGCERRFRSYVNLQAWRDPMPRILDSVGNSKNCRFTSYVNLHVYCHSTPHFPDSVGKSENGTGELIAIIATFSFFCRHGR